MSNRTYVSGGNWLYGLRQWELRLSKKNKSQPVKSPKNKLPHDVEAAKQTGYFCRTIHHRIKF